MPCAGAKAFFIKGSFLKFVAFREKIANCHCFHVEIALYFEKRACKVIRMRKIALPALKSAFGF